MKVLGVTGNIGGGKSTVVSVFVERGAGLIDADQLGREVVEKSRNFRKWLRQRFGFSIFAGDELNRAALGKIVFSDPAAKQDLDRKIWPLIRELLIDRIATYHSQSIIPVVDAAMIFEWGDQGRYDEILVVASDPEVAIERAARRLGLNPGDIRNRFSSQIPVEEKIHKADHVIRNEGTLGELKAKAEEYWADLMQRWNFRHDS